jgi:hypothetical protein
VVFNALSLMLHCSPLCACLQHNEGPFRGKVRDSMMPLECEAVSSLLLATTQQAGGCTDEAALTDALCCVFAVPTW